MKSFVIQKHKKISFFSKHLTIYFILLVFAGCSKTNKKSVLKGDNSLLQINVEKAIEQKLNIAVSKIAKAIEYVSLETNQISILRKINGVKITENYIFVSDRDKLLQFTHKGRFIRQIGRHGHGPGEYNNIIYFDVNEISDFILVQGEYQCNIYGFKGEFKKKVKTPSLYFVIYKPNRVAFYKSSDIDKKTNLILTDQNLKIICQFENYNPRPITNMHFTKAPLYVFNNKLYFKEYYNDTLYQVNDRMLIPHYIFKEQKLLLNKDFEFKSTGEISDLVYQLEKIKDKLLNSNIFESKRFLFLSYRKGLNPRKNDYTRFLFDKEKSSISVLLNNRFKNDFDCGPNIYPEFQVNDSIIGLWIDAYKLKEHVKSKAFKSSTPKYPEKKKELEKLANSLKDDDNPVLMLVKLKE